MTNEEMQKAMEFIVAMEARSSAKIDAIKRPRRKPTKDGRARMKGGPAQKLGFVRC